MLSVLKAVLDPWIRNVTPTDETLGEGSYGKVIELISDEKKVAGKVFHTDQSRIQLLESAAKVGQEIIKMLQLHHDHIVQCKGVAFLPDQSPLPVLLMERLMTSLHAYLLDPDNSNLPVERKVLFLLDTARGLDYLHSHEHAIIHRDLTAKNVLLDSQLRAKISDFGNSQIMNSDPNAIFTSHPGNYKYMPPEALGRVQWKKFQYSFSLDVFSFGHLSLFTITQTDVELDAPTYENPSGIVINSTGVSNSYNHFHRRRTLWSI